THNRAGGFPAPGSPARFTPRVMGPTATAALSAAPRPRLLHLARPDQPSPERISPVSGLAESGCVSQGTPASRVDEGITSSRAPSLRGHYPASSLLRTHPPPSRRQPTSRCCRLYGLPRFRPFGSGRGGLLQLPNVSWSSCLRYPPRRSDPPRQSACDVPCSLRPHGCGLGLRGYSLSGPPRVHFRYGPRTCPHPTDEVVEGLQSLWLPSGLPSQLRGFRFLPRQV